jgi:low affinity Fe/Cu permease
MRITMPPRLTKHSPSRFTRFAHAFSRIAGHPATFLVALLLIVVWAITGPLFRYSDAWQLVINTGTTIVTFLMVFLIQNSQNRDSLEIQLKLSELILAMQGARNQFASIEDLSDEELETLHKECRERAEQTGDALEKRRGAVASEPPTG